jgi:GNAT superfamily N-acetyltransferase
MSTDPIRAQGSAGIAPAQLADVHAAQYPGVSAGPALAVLVAPGEAVGHTAALERTAVAAYAGPPWEEDPVTALGAVRCLQADIDRDGFVMAVAGVDGKVCGFAYGVTARRLETLACAGPAPSAPFELRELAVHPENGGAGIGAALHDTLMAAASPGSRWLATDPRAHRALALYSSRGWRTAARAATENDTRSRILMHWQA